MTTTAHSIAQPKLSIDECLDILRREITDHKASDTDGGNPTQLELGSIRRMIAAFQPRSLADNFEADERHVETLRKVIGNNNAPTFLDPVTVWWSGKHWYVLDGHHRMEAYWRQRYYGPIPVSAFHGSLEAALERSLLDNSKDRLPMTADDKANAALKMNLYTDLSRARIAKACGVGQTFVSRQRRVIAQLRAEPHEKSTGDILAMGWKEAQLTAAGNRMVPYDPEHAALKLQAEQKAKALVRAVGRPFFDHPELVAITLRMLRKDLPHRLIHSYEWSDVDLPPVDGHGNRYEDY